jgi:hypothetical protein
MTEASSSGARAPEDQVTLIDSQVLPERGCNKAIAPFLMSKGAPWVVYFSPWAQTPQMLVAFVLFVLFDILLCRRAFGNALVGLSWGVNCPTAEHLVSYSFQPDPFVAASLDSNVFWITLIANFLLTAILGLVALARLDFVVLAVFVFLTLLQGVNVRCYLRCLVLARKQSEESFRNVMTYAPQQFPDAEDIPPAEEKRKEEQPATPAAPEPPE